MECVQKKYLLLLGCIATLALQGMDMLNASLNHANVVTQETAQKPLAKEAATLQKQLTYLVDCGYVEQIKQIFATLPDNLKEHKQDLVHTLISYAEQLKGKKAARIEQLKNSKIPKVHSWASAIKGTLETILVGISAFKVYHYLNEIYEKYPDAITLLYSEIFKKSPISVVGSPIKKIKKIGVLSIVLVGAGYWLAQDVISDFKKALTYRHELEKEVVVLDAIINYLKNEIA